MLVVPRERLASPVLPSSGARRTFLSAGMQQHGWHKDVAGQPVGGSKWQAGKAGAGCIDAAFFLSQAVALLKCW